MNAQEKAYELYERFLKGYLILCDCIEARGKSKECCLMVCDNNIEEINTFGDSLEGNKFITIQYWEDVKNEVKNI